MTFPALMTDLYELTMLAGYHRHGIHEERAVFDLFFRKNPFNGGYAVTAGLEAALDYLENLQFLAEDIEYLRSLRLFPEDFFNYLSEFRFTGDVSAVPEGTVVFPDEPLLTVSAPLGAAQFVETALLNIVNFQTLAATKGARLSSAAGEGTVMEFGLRRAQGPDGSLSLIRGAAVGGILSTSNVYAARRYGLPARGTHAHSWVMAFPDELTAFRAYVAVFPERPILLVDTYDTLKSGVPNAITVARELRERGYTLYAIRLDSGDLAYLSREARRMLDEAGFPDVKIVGSNDLDEYLIEAIRRDGGRIDIYGVGTRLAVCAGDGGGALGGVYKLVKMGSSPRLKVTGDVEKSTLPDRKRLLRYVDREGNYLQDVLTLHDEAAPQPGETVYDPRNPMRHAPLPPDARPIELHRQVMKDGVRLVAPEPLQALSERRRSELSRLPEGCLRFIQPYAYKVSTSSGLNSLRLSLIAEAEKMRMRVTVNSER